MRRKQRRTLGGLMALIAVVALPLAWYVHRAREFARVQAAADARRAELVAQALKEIEKLHADRARDDEILRRADEAIARAKGPPKPSNKSIPEQVRDIVKLMDENAKLEEESNRFREGVRARLRARLEKKRLEGTAPGGTNFPAPRVEDPR